jgi:hypothetical protein
MVIPTTDDQTGLFAQAKSTFLFLKVWTLKMKLTWIRICVYSWRVKQVNGC